MRCQRCGGEQRGALPGMACPGCGSVTRTGGRDGRPGRGGWGDRGGRGCSNDPDDPNGPGGSWIARETLAGRISTLPRSRKALLLAGAVVLTGSLAAAVTLLAPAGGEGSRTEAVGRAGVAPDDIRGGAPTRIGPSGTGFPDPPPATTPSASPSPSTATERPGPSRTAGSPGNIRYRYAAWAGPGCTTGEYREHGRYEDGDEGWYTVDSGGYRGSSCDGGFSALPMSGSPDEDRGNTATWSWHLGDGYRECALTVFVPSTAHARDVAGDPTFYRVLSDPDDADSAYTGFAVRQIAHRGSQVEVSSYPVKGDTFAVQLIDRGRDWGDEERVGAHHAAAQLKVSCR
ncbi:adhesin [Streptomyces sp. NPDC058239]|uniref:adhesin n=1 Tax=Streptomyces sp. NPDC058239 TaxID=3346395 RepID=UPI0036E63E07